MTVYPIRFTLSQAGAGGRQNKARCVAVEATGAEAAIWRVVSRYRGRNPHPYAIELEGRWRHIESRQAFRPAKADGALIAVDYEIGPEIASPTRLEVERPAWAAAMRSRA